VPDLRREVDEEEREVTPIRGERILHAQKGPIVERNRTLRSARFGFHEEVPGKPVLRLVVPPPRIVTVNPWKKWLVRALLFALWALGVILILSQGR